MPQQQESACVLLMRIMKTKTKIAALTPTIMGIMTSPSFSVYLSRSFSFDHLLNQMILMECVVLCCVWCTAAEREGVLQRAMDWRLQELDSMTEKGQEEENDANGEEHGLNIGQVIESRVLKLRGLQKNVRHDVFRAMPEDLLAQGKFRTTKEIMSGRKQVMRKNRKVYEDAIRTKEKIRRKFVSTVLENKKKINSFRLEKLRTLKRLAQVCLVSFSLSRSRCLFSLRLVFPFCLLSSGPSV